MLVTTDYRIGIEDVGENNEVTNKCFLEALTNVTNYHGFLIGQGTGHLDTMPLGWVVTNWKLEVYERPTICEVMTARTWVENYSHALANRGNDVIAPDGHVIARAASTWVAIDLEAGKPYHLDERVMGPYEAEPDTHECLTWRYGKVRDANFTVEGSSKVTVGKAMIDINDHVRNPMYLDLVMEALPEPFDRAHFDYLEVTYRAEVKAGDVVTVEYGTMADGKFGVRIVDDEGRVHVTMLMDKRRN